MQRQVYKGQNRKSRAVKSQILSVRKVRPLPTWDKRTFFSVAADRGYSTEGGLIHGVGEQLGLARATVKEMLGTGRFRWEQILVLGSWLEMTPREFCDCFLKGFFIEDELGHFKCHLDSTLFVLHPPKTQDARQRRQEEERERIAEELEEF